MKKNKKHIQFDTDDYGLVGREFGFVGCFLVISIMVGLAVLSGWIFSILWNWIVPIFWNAAPILNTWKSIGVLAIASIVGSLLFSWRKSD